MKKKRLVEETRREGDPTKDTVGIGGLRRRGEMFRKTGKQKLGLVRVWCSLFRRSFLTSDLHPSSLSTVRLYGLKSQFLFRRPKVRCVTPSHRTLDPGSSFVFSYEVVTGPFVFQLTSSRPGLHLLKRRKRTPSHKTNSWSTTHYSVCDSSTSQPRNIRLFYRGNG